MSSQPPNREILSVSGVNRMARRVLEGEMPMVFVSGEISNLATPGSGHWYFSLKDSSAQLRCAMFRNRNQFLRFKPKNGAQVVVRGRITLYEGRGEFQLVAEFMEETGEGALRTAFEKLRLRLQHEGLFDEARKQPLPAIPQHVGVITSPSGAAISDVLSVFKRRFPAALLSVLPVTVQGEFSERQIHRAIEQANSFDAPSFDVLLVTRGGGSLEDLWSFNSEVVARAIAGSNIPVVCAIGHESDFCIAEFAADLRAPTPSAAAELISPDADEWQASLDGLGYRLGQIMRSRVERHANNLQRLHARLQHPRSNIETYMQRLDTLETRLRGAIERSVSRHRTQLSDLAHRVVAPTRRVERLAERNSRALARLTNAVSARLSRETHRFEQATRRLDTLSPLATLQRGYAIVTHDEHVVIDATSVKPGDTIKARLMQGEISAKVDP